MFFRDIVKRWLSYEKPVESWEAVAYLDDEFSYKKMEFPTRSVLFVDQNGKRKVEYNYDSLKAVIGVDPLPHAMRFENARDMKAWEQGGPLPTNATPIKVSERKPAKLPPAIASDVNDRSK